MTATTSGTGRSPITLSAGCRTWPPATTLDLPAVLTTEQDLALRALAWHATTPPITATNRENDSLSSPPTAQMLESAQCTCQAIHDRRFGSDNRDCRGSILPNRRSWKCLRQQRPVETLTNVRGTWDAMVKVGGVAQRGQIIGVV